MQCICSDSELNLAIQSRKLVKFGWQANDLGSKGRKKKTAHRGEPSKIITVY
jgi:hypothetical protein